MEVSLLTEGMAWRPVASLPQSLNLSVTSGFGRDGTFGVYAAKAGVAGASAGGEGAKAAAGAQQLVPAAFGTQVHFFFFVSLEPRVE